MRGHVALEKPSLKHITFKRRISTRKKYEAYPESKDTLRVGRQGNFFCLLWQHFRRPWSFTCEPCSFDSGRTCFVWVRIQSPAKCKVLSVIRFLNAKDERPVEIHKQIVAVYGNPAISTCFFT